MERIKKAIKMSKLLAVILSTIIAVILPVGYFFLGYQYKAAVIETEAESNALLVSQIINSNPEFWRYEQLRFTAFISGYHVLERGEECRIIDTTGAVIAQNDKKIDGLAITRSHNLHDAGKVVGRVEIRQSLHPLIRGSAVVGFFSIMLGLSVYTIFRMLPLRALSRALRSLYEEKEMAKEKEEKLRTITNTTQDAIVMLDDESRISFWNQAAEKIFGYSSSEAIGKEMHTLLAPQRYYEKYRKGFANFRETGKGMAVGKMLELHAIRKGGEEFPIELSLSAIQIGEKWHAVGIIRDITERKRAEEALEASEDRFRSLVENTSDWVWEVDENSIYTYASPQIRDLLGYEPEEVLGKTPLDFMPSEEAGRIMTILSAITVKLNPISSMENINLHKDGRTVVLETSGVPFFDKAGSFKGYRGIDRDITERKRVEETLRESKERYKSVIDNVGIGISLISPKMEILSVNRQMKEWYPAIDVSQRPICYRLFNDPPREEVCSYCPTAKTLMDGLVHESITETPVEGGVINFRVVSSPLKDGGGNVIAAIELLEDVTVQKRAEVEIKRLNDELELKVRERTAQLLDAQEELVRKEKLAILGRLSGSVGHELRNPLGVISNAIYYLKTVMPGADEGVREYLDLIKNEVNNSERIISDLLDFARTKTPQTKESTALGLVSQGLAKCSIPENIILTVDVPETLPAVKVDPLQMGQVFQNLITNAVQVMPEGGELRISARRGIRDLGFGGSEKSPIPDNRSPIPDRDLIEISVSDTGQGISPENMKKLFQPLFTTKAKGIGLGLVVCRNLVEANGGSIKVESGSGKGTSFTVFLPTAG